MLIQEAIRAAGISADLHVVDDGQKATDFFDAADKDHGGRCPDLVLLDLNLPKKDGSEVLRHVRNSTKCKHARVLIVTSSSALRDRELTREANGFFTKPSDLDEFMKLGPIIREILEHA
jgi:DNA-binding response OmpR family regulator